MKTEFTPEEEALIIQVRDEYLARQTQQEPVEDIHAAVNKIWEMTFSPNPEIIICESPLACKKRAKVEDKSDLAEYWSLWHVGYAAVYDFAHRIGLEMDPDKLFPFLAWVHCCPYVLFDESIVYVSRKPVELHFNDAGQLHNDSGMSCSFSDGWGIYTLNGVAVDRQIVMEPKTQTLEQIRGEENEEVKRLRIERYGWEEYLDGVNAKLLHERTNDIEGTREYLFQADGNMRALLCVCPSTAKEFVLEVPPETTTCEEAQAWLSGGFSNRIISAS